MTTDLFDCSTEHIISNADFGTPRVAPVGNTPNRLDAYCCLCDRWTRCVRCLRCGASFCVGEAKGEGAYLTPAAQPKALNHHYFPPIGRAPGAA